MCQDEVSSADNLIELTPNLPVVPKNDLDDNNTTEEDIEIGKLEQYSDVPVIVFKLKLLWNTLNINYHDFNKQTFMKNITHQDY